ncbi:MAG: hypothetical protein WDO56_05170 [Gammaproteobacteria bacterium]
MTLDEYAKQTADSLRRAHNTKDQSAVPSLFADADRALAESNISESDQIVFWGKVKKNFESGQLLLEKQANSSLIALMQAIQSTLAARTTKK